MHIPNENGSACDHAKKNVESTQRSFAETIHWRHQWNQALTTFSYFAHGFITFTFFIFKALQVWCNFAGTFHGTVWYLPLANSSESAWHSASRMMRCMTLGIWTGGVFRGICSWTDWTDWTDWNPKSWSSMNSSMMQLQQIGDHKKCFQVASSLKSIVSWLICFFLPWSNSEGKYDQHCVCSCEAASSKSIQVCRSRNASVDLDSCDNINCLHHFHLLHFQSTPSLV